MVGDTGKRRQSRIELKYYQTADGYVWWRRGLSLLAILAVAVWLATSAIASRGTTSHPWLPVPSTIASKGPLSQPHAIWDSTCQACHVSFAPINGSRWSPAPWASKDAGSKKCAACHAGPIHHQNQHADSVPDCAECHRDHRGRDASLLAMDDSACTTCHQNLTSHRDGPPVIPDIPDSVTRFDEKSHPDLTAAWTARAKDARRIKFNHARHLAEGLPLEKGGKPWTFADLSEPDRARYGCKPGESLDRPIKLTCASCHETDPSELATSVDRRARSAGEPRSPGAYMRPIVYENHCAACHRLEFDAKLPDAKMRHGISAQEVFADLKQLYAAQAVKTDPDLLRQFVPPRPMPGQPASHANQLIQQAVDQKALTAAGILFGAALDENVRRQSNLPASRRGCVECHMLKGAAGPIVNLQSLASIEIEPPVMTPVWQEHAFFNHKTHRALDCAVCHAEVGLSKENGDRRLLPDIARCVTCHAPSGSENAGHFGGASSACTECHRYHNGDDPGRGLGAKARQAPVQQTLEQFLSGDHGARHD
jgi:predicted CXXCH cytochrome family protein